MAQIGPVKMGRGAPLAIIAGPCVIESSDHTLRLADALAGHCRNLNMPFVFKASHHLLVMDKRPICVDWRFSRSGKVSCNIDGTFHTPAESRTFSSDDFHAMN